MVYGELRVGLGLGFGMFLSLSLSQCRCWGVLKCFFCFVCLFWGGFFYGCYLFSSLSLWFSGKENKTFASGGLR